MIGDIPDIVSRIKATLPTRWFSEHSPVLDAVLSGSATAWSGIYSLLTTVRFQSRLVTATEIFLDSFAQDFFGTRLPRRSAELDSRYRLRIASALVREHATRSALAAALLDLTGYLPGIFEPARPADTGAYAGPALGYCVAGAWGNLSLPYQVFVSVRLPVPAGIAEVAGYGTAGPLARASLAESRGQVSNSDVYAAITSVLPTAAIAWTRISN